MLGYPIGIVLLWETYQPLQYRQFASFEAEDEEEAEEEDAC